MGVYRSKEKLTPKQRADLDEIMRPLSEDERAQIQRLINGEVDAEEDLPYRILITSAEIDVGKISLDNL